MLAMAPLGFPPPVLALRAGSCSSGRQPLPPGGVGRLEIAQVEGCSAMIGCAATSPLQLLAPRPRGPAVWVVAASHGGGLVAGDAIELEVSIGAGATACLGTQAETKVYRSGDGGGATQRLGAAVGEGALLALLPDPVSPFAGSSYEQVQRFELARDASLVILDAVTAGRAARGERWAFDRYRSRNEVRIAGKPLLADGVRLVAGEGPPLPLRLAGLELLVTVILLGPRVAEAARTILQATAELPAPGAPQGAPERWAAPPPGSNLDAPVLWAASPLGDGLFLRMGARSVEAGMAAVRSHLSFLAAPLDGDPLLRRP
jgi:urease accessory protein